jgi:hypothetical protein
MLVIYIHLLVPSRPWETISMDFLDGMVKTKHGYVYIFVLMEHFSKMVILILWKQTIDTSLVMRRQNSSLYMWVGEL